MIIILKYFWFFCGLWWFLIIYAFWRKGLNKLVSEGEITNSEMRIFQFRMFNFIVIPCIILQLIQIDGGFEQLFELPQAGFSTFWSTLAWLVSFAYWIALIYIIWFKSGGEYLSKFSSVISFPKNPLSIKLLITIFLLASLVSGIFLLFNSNAT